jgi:hypothetical protein
MNTIKRMTKVQLHINGSLPSNALGMLCLMYRYLVDWVLENKIIELSFGKGLHTEIVRRSIDVAKFLAYYTNLDRSHIDLIWDSFQGKHESIKHAIQIAISDLASVLSLEDLDYLFDKIRKVPYSEYDVQMLLMVRQCSIPAINLVVAANVREKFGGELIYVGKKKTVVWGRNILGFVAR